MAHILPRAPTTKKLHDALKAAFGPIPVGLSAIPQTPPGVSARAPYAILYPLWANLDGPPWGQDRHADAEWCYQLTCYAERGDQLEGMRDKAFAVFLGKADDGYTHDLDTASAKIMERDLKEDAGIGEAVGSIIPSELRFGLHATPADAVVAP